MYKKTKVREILYLLSREISASEIAETLHVSRNTVAHIKNMYEDNEMDIEELYLLDDAQMKLFYGKNIGISVLVKVLRSLIISHLRSVTN